MATIFTKIINGEIPGYIVDHNDRFFAILDIHPLNPGHILVIPRQEVDSVFELNDTDYSDLLLYAKSLTTPLQQATKAKRIGLAVEGFGVPHAHVHLIPLHGIHEIDPHRAKLADSADLQAMCDNIKKYLPK